MLAERTSASLPDHQQPWWPSRYGAEDQIGSLNEITPAQIVAAARLDQAPNESARPMDERVTRVLLPKTVHQQRISGDTLMGEQSTSTSDGSPRGSLDGSGAGDHDELFSGFHAYQFSTRQLARLYLLRGELLDARLGQGRWVMDLAPGAS